MHQVITEALIPEYASTEYEFLAHLLLFSPNLTNNVCRKKELPTK